jgi:hypothetical protein
VGVQAVPEAVEPPVARAGAGARAQRGEGPARRAFLAGERVDMGAIGQELGVSRVTLYRWVGNRGQLLGEVLAALAIQTARRERARPGHRRPGSRPGRGPSTSEVIAGEQADPADVAHVFELLLC